MGREYNGGLSGESSGGEGRKKVYWGMQNVEICDIRVCVCVCVCVCVYVYTHTYKLTKYCLKWGEEGRKLREYNRRMNLFKVNCMQLQNYHNGTPLYY
jgi:hypothetical protein